MDLETPLLRQSDRIGCLAWQTIFFSNVFMACISFSLVMPSLWHNLKTLDSSEEFYAWIVAIYSVGEALGSIAIGALSHHIGTKRSLILCTGIAFCGACGYALAALFKAWNGGVGPTTPAGLNPAPWVVLASRLLQGIGSGGQQTVEQAYLSIATPANKRTELTGKLSTFACLGFIVGPALGALVAQIPPFAIGALPVDSYTMQGWAMAALNVVRMFTNLSFFVGAYRPPPRWRYQWT